jgi:hypothetical protein
LSAYCRLARVEAPEDGKAPELASEVTVAEDTARMRRIRDAAPTEIKDEWDILVGAQERNEADMELILDRSVDRATRDAAAARLRADWDASGYEQAYETIGAHFEKHCE